MSVPACCDLQFDSPEEVKSSQCLQTVQAEGSAAQALFLPAGQTVPVNREKIH